MNDLFYIAAIAGFFALAAWYVRACDHLQGAP